MTKPQAFTPEDRAAAFEYVRSNQCELMDTYSSHEESYLAGILHERARAESVLVEFIEHYLDCDLSLTGPDNELSCFAKDASEALKAWRGEK